MIVRYGEPEDDDGITFFTWSMGKVKVGFQSLRHGKGNKYLQRVQRLIRRERVELHFSCRDTSCQFTLEKWIGVRPKSLADVLPLDKRVILMADNNKYFCSQRYPFPGKLTFDRRRSVQALTEKMEAPCPVSGDWTDTIRTLRTVLKASQ